MSLVYFILVIYRNYLEYLQFTQSNVSLLSRGSSYSRLKSRLCLWVCGTLTSGKDSSLHI